MAVFFMWVRTHPHFFLAREGTAISNLMINDRIRAREVRMVDENGVMVGIVPLNTALAKAQEASYCKW